MYVCMEVMYRCYMLRLIYASPNLIINWGVPSILCGWVCYELSVGPPSVAGWHACTLQVTKCREIKPPLPRRPAHFTCFRPASWIAFLLTLWRTEECFIKGVLGLLLHYFCMTAGGWKGTWKESEEKWNRRKEETCRYREATRKKKNAQSMERNGWDR